MSTLLLTKTKMKQGVWEGIITGSGERQPNITVTHQETQVSGVSLAQNEHSGHWLLSIPIPAEAISDGVQTILVNDQDNDEQIGHITLMAGEVLGDDIRAEMDLLRAELDMLKRAFRRHCVESV